MAPDGADDPRETLERLDAHLRDRSYGPVGPAVRNANMPRRGVVAYSVDAGPGECFLATALSHGDNDVNLILIDPAGRTVAHDVRPGPQAWVTHCPVRGGRFTARVQMARGSGEYYFAAYRGPRQGDPELAAFFGAREAAVERAELDAATGKRLEALDAELAKDGHRRVEEPRGLVLRQGQERTFPINLEANTCYAFASLAGPGVEDTDVFVEDGSGNPLARDAENDGDALVRFCAPSSGSYALRTVPHRGGGPVFVAGYRKGAEEAEATAEPEQPEQPLIEERSQRSAGLEENFRLLDADMQARGYRSHDEPARGNLTEGRNRDFTVELEGGKCYAILAVGDGGVRDLDLILRDPNGNTLDRDVEEDARPVVRVCPERSGAFTMRVQMRKGEGQFVYAPYTWPRGTRGPFGLSGLIYVRLAEVTALLQNEGYAPSPDYTPGKGTLDRAGASAAHALELDGGQCYTVLVVGGQGINDLDTALIENGREVATDGTHNAFPSLRHCPESDGRYRLQIRAPKGSGEYFYQVFVRQSE
ncbi:MAG: hypothetical protein ACODAU_13395 [Myxococcota bacterium]